MIHSNSIKNHKIENWTYANSTARTGATGFTSADIGKLAYQTDNQTYWRLTATTPTWIQAMAGPAGADGEDGEDGAAGPGLPTGGTVGQIPAKASGTDYDTEWVDPPAGGGGVVALDYHYDHSVTTSGDPGAGNFRLNSPTDDHMYMAEVDAGGQDYYPYQSMQAADNWIILRSVASPKTKWALFTVTGAITRHSDANNWCDIPVFFQCQSSPGAFSANDDFTVEFSGPST